MPVSTKGKGPPAGSGRAKGKALLSKPTSNAPASRRPPPITQLRLRLREAGFQPIPTIGKKIFLKKWQLLGSATAAEIAEWTTAWAGHVGTGLLTAKMPTLDIDILDADAASAAEALARERFEGRGIILKRVGQPPKLAIPFRTGRPFEKILVDLTAPDGEAGEKIELLAKGQMVVAFAIHVGTGKPYQWSGGEPGDIKWDELPEISQAEAKALVDDIVEMLCRDHGYSLVKSAPAGRSSISDLIERIINGHAWHETIRDLAAKLVAAGKSDEEGVRTIQDAMNESSAPRDERWRDRYADIERMIETAREKFGSLIEAKSSSVILDLADPMASARVMIRVTFTHADARTLHRHRGSFFRWTGGYYREVTDEEVRTEIWRFLEGAFRLKDGAVVPLKPNPASVGHVLDALTAACNLADAFDPPFWIGAWGEQPKPGEVFGCGNGLLHLPTGKLFAPTPNFFNLAASEVVFDPAAPPPVVFNTFLDQLFGDDAQAIEALQDFAGYSLTPDTSQQKIMMIIGPRRAGKGVIGRVLKRLLGPDSVAGPTMASLGSNFGLQPLIGKPLAIISDMRIGNRTDKTAITERLLSISGEDQLTIDRKFKTAWHGHMAVRFVILTNDVPSLSDGSGALPGRFLIVVLKKSFFGQEDQGLTNKLLRELPGILNWAIAGHRRLATRGHFVQPDSSAKTIDQVEMLAAPIKAFLRDECEVGPGFSCPVDELFDSWRDWCQYEENRDAGSREWFGRNLSAAIPGLGTGKPRKGDSTRQRVYTGVRLREQPTEEGGLTPVDSRWMRKGKRRASEGTDDDPRSK